MNDTVTHSLLTHAWFCLIGLMLVLYVITDGFDLGVGILSLLRPRGREADRNVMIESIGQVWDANETWLVVLAGALFGAFPAAYALLLSSLYGTIMLLIASLIMRGAAVEFRQAAAPGYKLLWDRTFGLGSLLAAVAQGIVLGRLLTGLQLGGVNLGVAGALNLGFILITVIGVVSGYTLLGATWLVRKTIGPLQRRARMYAIFALFGTVACAFVVTLGTWVITPLGSAHWTDPGVLHVLLFLGAIAAAVSCYIVYATVKGRDHGPFNGARLLFLVSFIGLAVSLFPDLVPGHFTVTQAASESSTLVFMLLGIGLSLPVMITYNVYQYRSFKGKVASAEH